MNNKIIRRKIAKLKGGIESIVAYLKIEIMRPNFFSVKLIMWDWGGCHITCHYRQGHDENIPNIVGEGETLKEAVDNAYIAWKESNDHP